MSRSSDVCLILEGTYPYVAGGVSSWVHQLITAMHDIRFSLLIIMPSRDYIREMKYSVPPNLVEIRHVFIHDYETSVPSPWKVRKNKNNIFKQLEKCIVKSIKGNIEDYPDLIRLFLPGQNGKPILSLNDLIYSTDSWQMLVNLYKQYDLSVSFIDYFWTYRFTVLPLIQLFNVDIPNAPIYHAISTGYAGILGAAASICNKSVLLITEHGIYSKERKIEIAQATWIYDEREENIRPQEELSYFKKWWITFFELLSRISYEYASEIITLFGGNQLEQIKCGADESKLSIIPNGIDMNKFFPIERHIDENDDHFVIGFVGRVVPIKDVKTFIKSIKVVLDYLPNIQVFIIGPTDEDEDYFEECVQLCDMLFLDKVIKFTGKVNIAEYYPKIDLVVLTSESEAQPLVILEANAMGIPVVASDVGACEELCFGRTLEDQALGVSGYITGVSDPDDTASAIVEILSNPELYNSMSKSGIERVRKFYGQNDLFAQYLNLYEKYMYW